MEIRLSELSPDVTDKILAAGLRREEVTILDHAGVAVAAISRSRAEEALDRIGGLLATSHTSKNLEFIPAPERAGPDGGFLSYAEAAAKTHPAVDVAVGALHNWLAAMREQARLSRVLQDAKAQIPVEHLDGYLTAAEEIGRRYRNGDTTP